MEIHPSWTSPRQRLRAIRNGLRYPISLAHARLRAQRLAALRKEKESWRAYSRTG